MPNYANGKVYQIKNVINDEVYVGSTTNSLPRRLTLHKQGMKVQKNATMQLYRLMNELGPEHFYIELIEDFPCASKTELLVREGHFIRERGTLNKKVSGRTNKEYYALYRADHRDEAKEYAREYRQKNADIINEKAVCCECGRVVARRYMNTHQKSEVCKSNRD